MDKISSPLHEYLTRLGQDPALKGSRMEHYMKHLLRLLPPKEEEQLKQLYGLFGTERHPEDDIAQSQNTTTDDLRQSTATSLRRIAVTPEWQMLQQVIKNQTT